MLKIKITQNIAKFDKIFPVQAINKINKLFIKEKKWKFISK